MIPPKFNDSFNKYLSGVWGTPGGRNPVKDKDRRVTFRNLRVERDIELTAVYVGRSNCNRCWEGKVLNITTQVSSRLRHNSSAYILLLGPASWVVYILVYVILEAVMEMSSWRNWGPEKWSISLTGLQLIEWSVGTEIWSLVGTKTLNSLASLRHWLLGKMRPGDSLHRRLALLRTSQTALAF